MSAVPVLKLHNVSKAFGATQAVRDVSLTVQKGEIFGFLGPNGAGKTTTIRLILSVLRPDRGSITLFDPALTPAQAHRRIGYLAGEMVMDEDLTGRQYLEFVNHLYGGGHEALLNELAAKLEAKLDTRIGAYSRGNRQKIGLIAALLHKPELLILDEPTSGFDPLIQEVFKELIQDFRDRGGTVFMSSHILSEVQELCDRVAFIRDGKIAGVRDLSQVTTAAKLLRATGPDAASLHFKGLTPVDGHAGSYTYIGDIKPLLAYLSKRSLDDVTLTEPELEETFMEYYQAGESA